MFFNSKPPNILVNESPSQALSLVYLEGEIDLKAFLGMSGAFCGRGV